MKAQARVRVARWVNGASKNGGPKQGGRRFDIPTSVTNPIADKHSLIGDIHILYTLYCFKTRNMTCHTRATVIMTSIGDKYDTGTKTLPRGIY